MSCLKPNFTNVARIYALISLFSFILGQNLCVAEAPADDIPNIIICTLGSMRNSETIDDESHQYIPNLWNKMFKYGTLYTNLINLNLPFHQPSTQAINTGVVMSEYAKLKVPSIFQYAMGQYRLPPEKVWSVGHWDNEETIYLKNKGGVKNMVPGWVRMKPFEMSPLLIRVLTEPELNSNEALIELRKMKINTWPFWDINEEVCYQAVKSILKVYKPKILHFVMDGVDSAHYDTFGRYVLAIKDTDQRLFEIWEFIQNDPFYKDNTYLFVALDHSRDRYYMHHMEYDSTRQGWLYVYGPNVKKGIKINRPLYHIDIFATVAYIMNLKTHPTKGKVLKDCFIKK